MITWITATAPVSTRYMRPEAKKIEKKSKLAEASWVLRNVSSCTETTEASDEFLSALTASLPSAGTIERTACGATMRSITTAGVMPRAWPAMIWPRSTAMMLPRMISAMKGASLSASARPAASTAVSFMPIIGSAL